ncbi:MAG: VTC domain-containing protein [Planctomycetes bacterium]|nr:VTC domain-containing protein [Planctomycetota bacterium]
MSGERLTVHTRERRYLLRGGRAIEALLRGRGEPHEFVPGRPETEVFTVYLDTAEGTWSRGRSGTKFRCRSYGEPGIWWFELKRRVGNVVDKWRHLVAPARLPALLAGSDRGPALRPFVGDRELLPLVAIRYRRTAWEWDGLRVTIDRDVAFYAVEHGDPWRTGERAGGIPGVVVEVKRDGPVPAWLAAALSGKRARRFSKSRRALAALGTTWITPVR